MLTNPVRTAKKTQLFTVTKINWLTLFEEIITVYSEDHTKQINTLCGQSANFEQKATRIKSPNHCYTPQP
jgi:uracil DNA glycosylase